MEIAYEVDVTIDWVINTKQTKALYTWRAIFFRFSTPKNCHEVGSYLAPRSED